MQARVFILGAGCSVECGYPSGPGLATELNNWRVPDECPTIKRSVATTLKLLERHPKAKTLDQLNAEMLRENRGLVTGEMLETKIATNALFLAKEERARQTGLEKYRAFINMTLGGVPWQDALRNADCHVLTFNYDQLFEVAFLDAFSDFDAERDFLYGEGALNSGFFLYGDCHLRKPTPDRFCFLKLHGSAGWQASIKRGGGRNYSPAVPVKSLTLAEVERRFPNQWGVPFGWEPLIAFPTEREGSQRYLAAQDKSSDYTWAPYIDLVWEHAATLLSNATEVRVIGYSFDPIDSRFMVERLLSRATKCAKIIIQNRVDVRKNLESYRELQGRLDYDPTPFGE